MGFATTMCNCVHVCSGSAPTSCATPELFSSQKFYDAHFRFSHHHLTNHGIVSSEAETITQHWSRDNLLATSYDVNLTTFAPTNNNNHIPTRGIHSRENTLSRDIHHITVSGFLINVISTHT